MNADDKIREILRLEAEAVEPSPAGWEAIQQGVASRRARSWWTRGTALAGAAAVFVGVTAYVAADRSQRGLDVVPDAPGTVTSAPAGVPSGVPSRGPSRPPTPSPTPSLAPVAAPIVPLGAIWPLTTTAELASWEGDPASMPALKTARGAALAFARRYLLLPEAEVVGKEEFGESRLEIRNGPFTVTTVAVKGFGTDGTAPFVVTRAESESLRITTPAAGATLGPDVVTKGTYEAVDPAIQVQVFGDGRGLDRGGSSPVTRAEVGPTGWSARIRYVSTQRTGSVLVTLPSNRDGSVASAAAVPVSFRARAAGPEAAVVAREGRIAVVSTLTGRVARWLTEPVPGAGAYDPELSDDGKTVVYAQATGTCSSEIRSVPAGGGAPTTLVTGEGRVNHPSRRGDVLAYVRSKCAAGGSDEQVVVRNARRVVGMWPGPVTAGPVAGERFVAFVTLTDTDGSVVHAVDALGELASATAEAPESSGWTALAWGPRDRNDREQLFVALEGDHEGDPTVRPSLHRFDADLVDRALVGTLDVPSAAYLDYADEYLIVGTEDRAYVIEGDRSRAIPGVAQRPTWS